MHRFFKKFILQKVIENKFIRLFSFKRSSKTFLISCFVISFFIFDLSKAESYNSTANKKTEIVKDNLDPIRELAENNLDSKNRSQIGIDYLESRNELEDYIIDTGDSISIKFSLL